jgi:hypothetical protein
MALVVTARATVEAQPALAPRATVPHTRLRVALRWLALLGAGWYGLSLALESALRLLPLGGGFDRFGSPLPVGSESWLAAGGPLLLVGQLVSLTAIVVVVAAGGYVCARRSRSQGRPDGHPGIARAVDARRRGRPRPRPGGARCAGLDGHLGPGSAWPGQAPWT